MLDLPTALMEDKIQHHPVLVTGGTGLVGSFIVRRFVQAGYPVRVLVRPTSDRTLLAAVAGQEPGGAGPSAQVDPPLARQARQREGAGESRLVQQMCALVRLP